MKARVRQHGFTLIEMLLALALVAALLAVMSSLIPQFVAFKQREYEIRQEDLNMRIVSALLAYAAQSDGTLPAPYAGGGWKSAPGDPDGNTPEQQTLLEHLVISGVPPAQVASDGTAAERQRVYQLVEDIPLPIPFFGATGPQVNLKYDMGVVYMTECPRTDTVCNAAGVLPPGASAKYTEQNRTSWDLNPSDVGLAVVSTAGLQREWLAATGGRIREIQRALLSYVQAKRLAGGPDAYTDNHWPSAQVADLSGGDPANNQGCADGWYAMNVDEETILPTVLLNIGEYSVTRWGGVIEYCRDYQVNGIAGPPHHAALRIHSDLTAGNSPSTVSPGNNVVFPM